MGCLCTAPTSSRRLHTKQYTSQTTKYTQPAAAKEGDVECVHLLTYPCSSTEGNFRFSSTMITGNDTKGLRIHSIGCRSRHLTHDMRAIIFSHGCEITGTTKSRSFRLREAWIWRKTKKRAYYGHTRCSPNREKHAPPNVLVFSPGNAENATFRAKNSARNSAYPGAFLRIFSLDGRVVDFVCLRQRGGQERCSTQSVRRAMRIVRRISTSSCVERPGLHVDGLFCSLR